MKDPEKAHLERWLDDHECEIAGKTPLMIAEAYLSAFPHTDMSRALIQALISVWPEKAEKVHADRELTGAISEFTTAVTDLLEK